MQYLFRCEQHGDFEISQPITAEHRYTCPECGAECRRIFTTLQWIWAGTRYREDGSRREDKDYAPVMNG